MARPFGEMACVQCGQITPRRSANQKYCADCRAERQRALQARRGSFHLGHELAGEQLKGVIDALRLMQRRADLLAINQIMFVNDLERRATQAERSGLSAYVSPAQLNWFEALHLKVGERVAAEQEAVRMHEEAKRLQQLIAQDAGSNSVN
jgi:hypothetical protein